MASYEQRLVETPQVEREYLDLARDQETSVTRYREIKTKQMQAQISQELENVPDIRFWFLDENGLRAIALVVTGVDSNIVNNVASELATQMNTIGRA